MSRRHDGWECRTEGGPRRTPRNSTPSNAFRPSTNSITPDTMMHSHPSMNVSAYVRSKLRGRSSSLAHKIFGGDILGKHLFASSAGRAAISVALWVDIVETVLPTTRTGTPHYIMANTSIFVRLGSSAMPLPSNRTIDHSSARPTTNGATFAQAAVNRMTSSILAFSLSTTKT